MNKSRTLTSEEIELLLDVTISAESSWDVLISSRDENLCQDIHGLLLRDERVKLRTMGSGSKTLISCGRVIPDLIIIDTQIDDISPEHFIQAIRNDEKLRNIPIICWLREEFGQTLPDWGADDYIRSGKIVETTNIFRKIHSLLVTSRGCNKQTADSVHERQWPRTKLNIGASIVVTSPDDPQWLESGEAIVQDISLGGANLSGIRLESGKIPNKSLRLTLHIDQSVLYDWRADSAVVHREPDGTIGVKFVNISRRDRLKIAELFCE
jgi:CheY-like chemotaxis protein